MSEPREAFVELQERLDRPGTPMLDRLREVQIERGGVGDEDLDRLAGEFGWPVAAVTGTVSFYADFAETTVPPKGWRGRARPPGRWRRVRPPCRTRAGAVPSCWPGWSVTRGRGKSGRAP